MKNKCFTLIELLVVVAILGVLMSLLLPSISKARERTKAAVCLSNFKQVGFFNEMAISMAWKKSNNPTDEHNKIAGQLVPRWRPPYAWAYIGGEGVHETLDANADNPAAVHKFLQGFNCPNYELPDISDLASWGDGILKLYFYAANENLKGGNYQASQVSSPNEFLMNTEKNPTVSTWDDITSGAGHTGFDKRHLNTANTLFLDGHAKSRVNVNNADLYIP
ncbi:MAG: type II secretion system GspH family protein [Lentisphaeraceae bacterium]|nr:type II secretion system GspH family protein [Lentisphaeraceae bacterium]